MGINYDNKILISRLKQGDKSAFELVFKKYYAPLCHYAENFLKDAHAAEDVVAQVFCNIFLKRTELSIETLQPYLFSSVRNHSLNYLRSKKDYSDFEEAVFTESQTGINSSDKFRISGNPFLHKEAEKLLQDAVNKLPAQCKEVFVLCRNERLTHKQIAEKLGISVNTVETQMSRAIKKLSFLLGGYLKMLMVLLASF